MAGKEKVGALVAWMELESGVKDGRRKKRKEAESMKRDY